MTEVFWWLKSFKTSQIEEFVSICQESEAKTRGKLSALFFVLRIEGETILKARKDAEEVK